MSKYRSFEEHCIWLNDAINEMFENMPDGDLKDMPHSDEEMAALSYGQAHAEHVSDRSKDPNAGAYHYDERLRQTVVVYGPSRAKLRLNIGRRR